MPRVDKKTEIASLDATPDKRSFWSIISDYNLKTGLCELIDNALDIWALTGRAEPLHVDVNIEVDRQAISVTDNAGGVRLNDLRLLVAPGASKNSPDAESIGIFGVGSKRAVIALGAQVSLKTHHPSDGSFQIDITNDWLASPTWELPAYAIPDIPSSTTTIELTLLRRPLNADDPARIRTHFGEVYSGFLGDNLIITVNDDPVTPITFDAWAFPPDFPPQQLRLAVTQGKQGIVQAIIVAGLIRDRIPEASNYGVYFYCNGRMIVKELKTREVGYYVSTEAGVPHPDASLCRALVSLKGPAKLMPWTSNKTGINTDHPIFTQIRPSVIQLVSQFSKISRALKNNWPERVLQYKAGKVVSLDSREIRSPRKIALLPIPRVNKSHAEHLKLLNRKRITKWPWTLGLVEAIAAVDIIQRQRLETRNRIALLLLDSTFEIALKEFIVHNEPLFPKVNLTDLFKNRDNVISRVAAQRTMETELLGKAKHYYRMRNQLVHERATVDVLDSDIDNYSETVKRFLKLLFELEFDEGAA